MASTNSITQVTFVEGAPLDPADLNLLMANTQYAASTAALHNTTIDGIKTIPSTVSGSVSIEVSTANKIATANLPKFEGDPYISLTANKTSAMSSKVLFTVFVDKSSSPWKACILSNAVLGTVDVDFIAIEMKPLV